MRCCHNEKNQYSTSPSRDVAARIAVFLLLLTLLWFNAFMDSFYNSGDFTKHKVSDLGNSIASSAFKKNLTASSWEINQLHRKDEVEFACSRFRRGHPPISALRLSKMKSKFLNKIVVDDVHQSLYCYIPKIACTNWKRLMMVMSRRTNETDPMKIRASAPHQPGAIKFLSSHKIKATQVEKRLTTYSKFLFVRHPFERLVSAYRNKFESKSQKYFINVYGPKILQLSGNATVITFSAFVDYLIWLYVRNNEFDEHWAPYVTLCHPCHIPYDFIGKYESLYEDAEEILSRIKAPKYLHFPVTHMSTTSKLVSQYFKNLTQKQTKFLYKIYEADFLVFGYSKNLTENLIDRTIK